LRFPPYNIILALIMISPKKKFEIIIDSNIGGNDVFDLISKLFAKYQGNFKHFELVLPMQLVLERGYIDPILFLRKSLANSYSALARFYRANCDRLRIAETDISDDFIDMFYEKAINIAKAQDANFWRDIKSYVNHMIEIYGHGYEEPAFADLENLNCYELQALYDFGEIRKKIKLDEEFQAARKDSGERAIHSYLKENMDKERAMMVISDDVLAKDYIRKLRKRTGYTIFVLGTNGFKATCKNLGLINISSAEISDIEQKWSARMVDILNKGYW